MPRTKSTARKTATPASPAKSTLKSVHNTTQSTSTPPYSREGPTLPIIGGGPTNLGNAQPLLADGQDSERRSKKRRTEGAAPSSLSTGPRRSTADTTNTKSSAQQHNSKTDNAALYEPWILLPAPLREVLATQSISATPASSEQLRNIILPIVFTKNQNIKSGVNKLKTYLTGYVPNTNTSGEGEESEEDGQRRINLEAGKGMLAVSAQGEGTVKLVGIVEMVRRVVSPTSLKQGGGGDMDVDGGEDGTGKVEEWYMYTVLSSREEVRERPQKETSTADPGEAADREPRDDDDGAFESLADIREKDKERERERKTRKVPVLTVWFSQVRIEGFKDAFGEELVRVARV